MGETVSDVQSDVVDTQLCQLTNLGREESPETAMLVEITARQSRK